MFAVHAAIRRQASQLKNAHILVQSDNRTLVAYICNEGGTRSLSLLDLTCKLLTLTDRLNICLSAHYLPERYNCIADHLSRDKRLPEWHLLPAATERLFSQWGTLDVDLFASAETAVVKDYISLDTRDRLAIYSNAFSRQWNFQLGWIFPPANLLSKVLAHLNSARGRYMIIASQWEKTFWMSYLKSRALEGPVTIKNLQEVLVDVSINASPPQVDRLILQAWLVGGGGILLAAGLPPRDNF